MNKFMTQVPLVFFEEGAVGKAGVLAKMMGVSKAMLVFDQGIRDAGIADRVIPILESVNIDVIEYTKVVPDPIYKDINEGGKIARREKVNAVIGLGGGSSMDTAKGIYTLLGDPDCDNIMDFCMGGRGKMRPMKRANALLMVIPTTSGTGSEVSTGAVITDDEIDYKALLGGLQILPHIALIDPQLDLTIPRSVMEATAMDTLAHGMESYLVGGLANKVKPSMTFNEWSDMLALEDVRMIFTYLPKALENQEDIEARSHLKYASMVAGICMCAGGLTLGHGMAQAMGALWHIPHGVGCSLGLVPSIRQGAKLERNTQERFWRLADAAGLDFPKTARKEELVDALCQAVETLSAQAQIPTLREMGRTKEEWLDKLVEAGMRDPSCYVSVTEDELREHFEYLFDR
ncbi:MAG: iron-containing alcohol dehydrogenase [Bilifractor sp.]|jgi:alcohol dehydrogenase